MQENIVNLETFTLMGISTRATNAAEMAGAGEIPKLWQRFYGEGVIRQIPNALKPGEIIAAYTDFESDDTGVYTLIIGAAVAPGTKVPAGMVTKEVNASRYLRVTTERGHLAEIGVAAWVKIWRDQPLRNERAFRCDLEIYDAAAANPDDAEFDIYLGLKS